MITLIMMILTMTMVLILMKSSLSPSFPAHPAGSFHYPSLPRLPILAQYSVIKVKVMMMMTMLMSTMIVMIIADARTMTMENSQGLNQSGTAF